MTSAEQSRQPTGTPDHRRGDAAVKLWFLFALLWFPLFATLGFVLAIKFFAPDFLGGTSWLSFGLVRPAHTNGVLFGFVSSGLLGTMLWITPRLCGIPLHRPGIAKATAVLWNGALVAGIIWILAGGSQAREYAELPWVIDVAVVATLLLLGWVVFGTVTRRTEPKLYVSLWYYMGTLVWFPIVYFIGNVMWHPATGALNGVQDAIFNWYYGHNVLGLWFTTLGIPAWYYFVPRLINRPLFSHLLSLIAFFSIAFFYTGVGAHHLLQAPIPEWLKTVAVIMSVLMLVPVLAFATNIILTMRGSWRRMFRNPALQFILAGFAMYVLASVQGSFQAIRATNAFLHFSQWPVGHAHLALLGGFGFLAVGAMFRLIPKALDRGLDRPALATPTFWIAFLGFSLFFLAMTIAGLVANSNWWEHINVVETLVTLRVHFIFRAMAGGIVVIAAFLFAFNGLMTFVRARRPLEDVEIEPASSRSSKPHSPVLRRSQREISLPAVVGGGMAVFSLTTFMVVAMPYMFTTREPSADAHEPTEVEALGESVYKANGCFYCHNQFVRPQDWAMGEVSENGDFYYSVPNFLGTERTGPVLGQIGGKRPTEWHVMHHRDPRAMTPQSIMPPFDYLSDSELDGLAAYLQGLGSYDLDPHGFAPLVPAEYRGAENPNMKLIGDVRSQYDAEAMQFNGDASTANAWTTLVEEGKQLYAERCLSCHGGSGNGDGPYARQTLAQPANLHNRISSFPQPSPDAFHHWRISSGVPGTAMPPWGMSLDEETIWKIATYEMTFVFGVPRTVPDTGPPDGFEVDLAPIDGTEVQYRQGEALFALYCVQCHGADGTGTGPASIASEFGYIRPQPADLTVSANDIPNYGSFSQLVHNGVPTTNMPPWKVALSDDDIVLILFYVQSFADDQTWADKWGPLYTDPFASERPGGEG